MPSMAILIEKRQVVHRDDGENSRLDDLQHQRRHANQEQARQEWISICHDV